MEAITDVLVAWLMNGPLRQDERVLAGIPFYEETVAERVIIGYA